MPVSTYRIIKIELSCIYAIICMLLSPEYMYFRASCGYVVSVLPA
jgi:hypothetical protein